MSRADESGRQIDTAKLRRLVNELDEKINAFSRWHGEGAKIAKALSESETTLSELLTSDEGRGDTHTGTDRRIDLEIDLGHLLA